MSRAYLRLDPAFFEKKVIQQGYSAGEFAALTGALCLAESQLDRGRFRNERYLRAILADFGRHVPTLVKRGDLTVLKDGRIYIDGWDEWQEGDYTVRERVARTRNRKRDTGNGEGNGDSNGGPANLKRDTPYSGSGALAVSGAGTATPTFDQENDPAVALADRTGSFPRGKMLSWINDLGARHGDARVAALIRGTPLQGDARQYLEAIADTLRRDDYAAEKAEAQDEKRRLAEKRSTAVSPVVAQLREALLAKEMA